MNDIETDEIESFTLLKDAAATAVYGAEGANGVILITSKRGTSQKPRISFRAEGTMNTPTRLPKFMNAAETLTLYNEAVNNEGSPSVFSAEEIAKYASGEDPDLYPDTDWQDIMLRDHTYNMRYTLNVRGGSERARYFVSGAFFQENGIFKDLANDYDNNIGLKRYNLRSNIDFDATKSTVVKIDLSGQYIQLNRPGADSVDQIFEIMCRTPAFLMPPVYSDGTLALGHDNLTNERSNPYNMLVNYGYSKEWRTSFQSKVEVDQELAFITKGLSFKALISFKNWSYNSKYRLQGYNTYQLTDYTKNEDGTYNYTVNSIGDATNHTLDSFFGTDGDRRFYIQGYFNYDRAFGDHHVGGMLLYNQDEYNSNVNSSLLNSLPKRRMGIAVRAAYDYANRYLFEFNAGYNGSENFAKGHRFGFFPSVSVGWNISQEKFWEPIRNIVSNFKIRGSYGLVGNDQVPYTRFLYMGITTLNDSPSYQTGYGSHKESHNGPTFSRFENEDMTWEVGHKLNVGADIQLFNSLNLTVDAFREIRSNILTTKGSIPNYLGAAKTVIYGNFAKVKNWGVDLAVDYGKQINRDLSIQFKGTFTFARNRVMETDEAADIRPALSAVGKPLNTLWGYVADGLYIDEADIALSLIHI